MQSLDNVSVRFYSGKLLIWIKCQCQCQVWTPGNLIWHICAEHGSDILFPYIPSDTKLLLTKNYSKIIIFEKLRISYVIPWKSPSFPEILRVLDCHKITKNNSQGIIFVIISCQRVPKSDTESELRYEEQFRTFRVPHYNQGSYQNLTV